MGRKRRKIDADTNQYARDDRSAGDKGSVTPGKESSNGNPPRTTSHGWLTTPKFGSSTSGGGEIEQGPERD